MPARKPDPAERAGYLDELADVAMGMNPAVLAALEEHLDPEDRQVIERIIAAKKGAGWRTDPFTMGHHFGALDDLPHTRLLARKFREAFDGTSPRQIWNLPPQHGKSLIVKWGCVWALDTEPTISLGLFSYAHTLARRHAVFVRDTLVQHGGELRTRLRPGQQRQHEFVTNEGGGLQATGLGGAITGFGFNGIVIDDPYKNWEEAHSDATRESVSTGYATNITTRLNRRRNGVPAFIIIVQCMTGDTPVRMANGTEKPLRNIQPGDVVATYERGRVTSATVRNWANQGPDSVFAIRMKSGTVVKANARHPFLVLRDGVEIWERTDKLKKGSRILRVTGESGAALPARSTSATRRRDAKGCACPTTTRRVGRPVYARRPSIPNLAALPISVTAMASMCLTTTRCSLAKVASALFASNHRQRGTLGPIGMGSSASIIATTPAAYEACFATTATSSSATAARRQRCEPPLNTYAVETDEVVEVVPYGVEDVFDLQVDRTENFIANGLVSHNTRWHEEDLSGEMITADEGPDGEGYEVVRLPAIAEDNDALGRQRGEALAPTLHPLDELEHWRRVRGSYLFAGLYQQRPSPEEGGEIKRAWFVFETSMPPVYERTCTSWDVKLKDTTGGDYVVGQAWGRVGSNFWCYDQLRGQYNFATTKVAIALMSVRHPEISTHYVENTGNGPEVMRDLRAGMGPAYVIDDDVRSQLGITERELPAVTQIIRSGLPGLVPVQVKGPKPVRVRRNVGIIEARNVHLPEGVTWTSILVDESASFPTSNVHDDTVDAMTQALDKLKYVGDQPPPRLRRDVVSPKPSARATRATRAPRRR